MKDILQIQKELPKTAEGVRFVDTHSHLYDAAFKDDSDEAVDRAVRAGVTKIIQPDVDSSEREALFSLTAKHKGVLFPMLGLYPGSVGADWEEEIDKMMSFKDKGIVAIGEIGLDYHYSKDTASLQKEALRRQLQIASKLDLPVNIHLRDAVQDFVSIISECRSLGIRGNLHAFSLSWETYMQILRYGDFSVGIGGVLTFRNSRLGECLKKIPLEKILLETDSPYMTPVPYRGVRNESMFIPFIASAVAAVKGISLEETAAVTTSNAEKLFRI